MNSGLYGACAGLMARMEALDTVAANVANSSTTGFRGQENSFGTVLAETGRQGRMSALNQVTNAFSQLAGSHTDETQGTITRTGNELDLAIKGEGYFKIKTATGFAYTRNGEFQVDANGRLTTTTGDLVMGEGGGSIVPGKSPLSIASSGIISSNGAISGKLAIVTFAAGTKLDYHGAAQYGAPAGTEGPASGASVQQGALEDSNVSPIEGVVNLVSAQRAAESMRHALTLIDGEMDKTAVQDLARNN
ncbi:MAG TPA: flagellar hook basal-body protein [Acidobacteriaceae bacterium]|nr:flagellar hook basal-body protein [Acidobacteriaceae bacterium]